MPRPDRSNSRFARCVRPLAASFAAGLLAAGCAGPRVGQRIDARTPREAAVTLTEVRRAGPFYERVVTSTGDVRTSLRPFLWTRIEVPSEQARLREVLWPLYSDRARAERFAWRFLLAYGADFDVNDPASRHYTWVLPFWFHGRNAEGRRYAALFPVGGTLRDFLTYDRIRFALFPLWIETLKRDVRGRNWLWPIFARIDGGGQSGWRVFPLAGRRRKEGDWDRHFVLWPIWTYARYHREPTAGTMWVLMPLFGRAERGVESYWTLLPPFFHYTRGRGRNEGYRRLLAPWPLVRIEDSPTVRKRHFWPLYARTERLGGRGRETHVLWPLFRHSLTHTRFETREAWSLAPLLHWATLERRSAAADAPPRRVSGYGRLWPLFSHVEHEGHRVLRIPDFSLQRRVDALERNLLGMATLYTRGSEPDRGRVEHDLLWGLLYRRTGQDGIRGLRLGPLWTSHSDAGSDASSWRILGGLLGRDRQGGSGRWRVWSALDPRGGPALPEEPRP